jgi:hypothetical protein
MEAIAPHCNMKQRRCLVVSSSREYKKITNFNSDKTVTCSTAAPAAAAFFSLSINGTNPSPQSQKLH